MQVCRYRWSNTKLYVKQFLLSSPRKYLDVSSENGLSGINVAGNKDQDHGVRGSERKQNSPHLFDYTIRIGILTVNLVDKSNLGYLIAFHLPVYGECLTLHTTYSAENEHSTVKDT